MKIEMENINNKLQVLIVYTSMIIGGATTSLLSLLNTIDYSKYNIELLLDSHNGERQSDIPEQVKLLPPARVNIGKSISGLASRLFNPNYVSSVIKSRLWKPARKNRLVRIQLRTKQGVKYHRRIDKIYDTAISYLEMNPFYYTSKYVKAKRKIAWIHVDYKASGMMIELDMPDFPAFDKIVFVSESCRESFCEICQEFADKAVCIPNIMSQTMVRKTASIKDETVVLPNYSSKAIKFISVCRIVFAHKGLDRGVEAFSNFSEKNFQWYIIGDGEDFNTLDELIKINHLEDKIFLLGTKSNPLPYVNLCNVFFLPSRFEGKPMAVTEAHMLGLPVLVSEYSSANEQIQNGIDGIITPNSVEGIKDGIRTILNNPEMLDKMKANVESSDYSNISVIKQIYELIEMKGE